MNILCHRNLYEFLNNGDEGILPEVIPICVITNRPKLGITLCYHGLK